MNLNFLWRLKNKFYYFYRVIKTNVKIYDIPYKISRRGSDYGGWNFAITPKLEKSTIILCGAGEDISFDIEITSEFNCSTYIVDPTPRAVKHFKSVLNRIGKGKEKQFNKTGCQEIESYDMSVIKENQIHLLEKALWNQNKTLKFFAPKHPKHVSHSLINYQNNYSTDSISIEVQAIDSNTLFNTIKKETNIEILKLDIEGAEHEFLYDLISNNYLPNQILVEYDELMLNSIKAIKRFKYTHEFLSTNGYKLFYKEGTNYSYLLC